MTDPSAYPPASAVLSPEMIEAMTPPAVELPDDPRAALIVERLRHVYDPEIPVNVYELGLIYRIFIEDGNHAHIMMTLTSPNCPVAEEMPGWVQDAATEAEGIDTATVEITWDPPWNPSLMAETARYQLNMFDL